MQKRFSDNAEGENEATFTACDRKLRKKKKKKKKPAAAAASQDSHIKPVNDDKEESRRSLC